MLLICKIFSKLLPKKSKPKEDKRKNPGGAIRHIHHLIRNAKTVDELYVAGRQIVWLGEMYWDYPDIRDICESLEEDRIETLKNMRGNTINPIYGSSINN